MASEIHGSGNFRGNDLKFHTYGHANNPVHGNNYLQNYLNLWPGTGVGMGTDHTIFAVTEGQVTFRKGLKGRTFVSVAPLAAAAE